MILMDVADGILPSIDPPRGSHPDPEEVELYEEERRLFYVGMTRAKEELAIFRFRREGLESTFANTLFPYDQKWPTLPNGRAGQENIYRRGTGWTTRSSAPAASSAARATSPASALRTGRRSALRWRRR